MNIMNRSSNYADSAESVVAAAEAIFKMLRGWDWLDGDMNEPAWIHTATTGAWKAEHVVPFAEARALWDDASLYVGLAYDDPSEGGALT